MVKFFDGGGSFGKQSPRPTAKQLEVRAADAATKATVKWRKVEGRRKIVVGAELRSMATEGDAEAARVLERCIARLNRPHDVALFPASKWPNDKPK